MSAKIIQKVMWEFPDFNWRQYVSNYPDLQAAKIDTEAKACTHWMQHGLKAGRTFRIITPTCDTMPDGQRRRAAVIFHGLLRSYNHTQSNLESYVFKPLAAAGFDTSIYCHTFKLAGKYFNIRARESARKLDIDHNIALLNPTYLLTDIQEEVEKTIDIKKYLIKGDPWRMNKTQALKFHILSLWSRKRISSLLQEHLHSGTEYDMILFIRSDVKFNKPLNIPHLYNLLQTGLDCALPDFQHFSGYNDGMLVGKPEIALKYGFYFDEMEELAKSVQCNSETCNKLLLEKFNAKVHLVPGILFKRIRTNGQPSEYDAKVF